MCGITSQFIRRMWLRVADLTLKKAVDIAVSMELTNKEIAKILVKLNLSKNRNCMLRFSLQQAGKMICHKIVSTKILSVRCVIEKHTLIHNVHKRCLPHLELKGNFNNRKLSKGRKREKNKR